MSRTSTVDLPLRTLRLDNGVNIDDMARILSSRAGKPISVDYVKLLEYRGTDKHLYISAYAEATQRPISIVAEAAKLRDEAKSRKK